MRFRSAKGGYVGPFSLNKSAAAIRKIVHCVSDGNAYAKNNESKEDEKPEKPKLGPIKSSGTGFYVAPGHILTNWHVVKACTEPPVVQYPNYQGGQAYIKGKDEGNDLALLETKMQSLGIASFRRVPKLGEGVASFGFPYSSILTSDGNFTLGNVTGTTGFNGDSRFIQFSAPTQPGNSGGPVMDMSGRVIGVTKMVMKPPDGAVVAPQNVNFAITASVAMNFLEVKEINPQTAPNTQKLDPELLAELAKKYTVHITCK